MAVSQLDDQAEHAAIEAAPGQLRREALDGAEPGTRGRRLVEHEAGMAVEPSAETKGIAPVQAGAASTKLTAAPVGRIRSTRRPAGRCGTPRQ